MTKPVDRDKLVEEIETKTEEWRVAIAATKESKYSFMMNTEFHEGIVAGLDLAKTILEEHDGE